MDKDKLAILKRKLTEEWNKYQDVAEALRKMGLEHSKYLYPSGFGLRRAIEILEQMEDEE